MAGAGTMSTPEQRIAQLEAAIKAHGDYLAERRDFWQTKWRDGGYAQHRHASYSAAATNLDDLLREVR